MRNADSSVVKMFSDRVSYATGVQTDVEVEDWQVTMDLFIMTILSPCRNEVSRIMYTYTITASFF